MKLKIVPPGFDLPALYKAPALTANTVYAENVVPAPATSSRRIRKQTAVYDASVSVEPQYKKAIKASRCQQCTNRKDLLFCGAHFGSSCGNCMVMGYQCRFEGVDMVEINSMQVAPPLPVIVPIVPIAPAVPAVPVVPPVPVVSAAFINGVIVVTANNIAANTPVQVVYDLTGEDVIYQMHKLLYVLSYRS